MMATITVDGSTSFQVPDDTRLVRALEQNGVDILHRCGGYARCTTCRVEFITGEPEKITVAELDKLVERGLSGQVRLSCQILCDHDMDVHAVMRFSDSGLSDPGPEPEATITPDPDWTTVPRATS